VAWLVAKSSAPISRLQHLALGLVISISPSTAFSGAWTPKAGRANVIVSASVSQTPAADAAITTDLYYERGLGKGWALVLSPSVSDQDNIYARNEAQVSLRRSLYEKDGWALSAQAGAYIWKETASSETSSGVELRLAAGKAFGQGGWADFETAARQCGGNTSVRWEATLGHQVRRLDRAMIKVFGDGEGCAANITRLQTAMSTAFHNHLA
jgi:outer membrane protein assembly factor BamB